MHVLNSCIDELCCTPRALFNYCNIVCIIKSLLAMLLKFNSPLHRTRVFLARVLPNWGVVDISLVSKGSRNIITTIHLCLKSRPQFKSSKPWTSQWLENNMALYNLLGFYFLFHGSFAILEQESNRLSLHPSHWMFLHIFHEVCSCQTPCMNLTFKTLVCCC